MDIKLMRNSEKGIFYSINDRLLMQITDDNYQYQGLRTSEHRSMYSYVRLSIDRCTTTYV